MKRLWLWLLLALVILPLGCFIWGILPSPQDHRFDQQKLLGLTVDQVIQRFGPPDYDDRAHGWQGEAAEGRAMAISYNRHWNIYVIFVRDGRVVGVEHHVK
jgi:hypothetical protein